MRDGGWKIKGRRLENVKTRERSCLLEHNIFNGECNPHKTTAYRVRIKFGKGGRRGLREGLNWSRCVEAQRARLQPRTVFLHPLLNHFETEQHSKEKWQKLSALIGTVAVTPFLSFNILSSIPSPFMKSNLLWHRWMNGEKMSKPNEQ